MTDSKIPAYWTPEQATAVFEFVDEIRDEILALYQIQITEHMKGDRCYDPQCYEEFEDKDIPF